MIEYYRRTLIALAAQLRAVLEMPAAFDSALDLQEALIKTISRIEGRIRKTRHERRNVRRQLRRSGEPRLSKVEALNHKSRVVQLEERIRSYQWILTLCRTIGDGIAFTYIDRWDVKPLAFRPAPGFISGQVGNRLERRVLRRLFADGRPAILNDLTNCLRIGDITLPQSVGPPLVVEVKSGSMGARGRRQAAEASTILEYLHSDTGSDIYGLPGPFYRSETHTLVVEHGREFNELIRLARRTGSAWRQVENGLIYFVATAVDDGALAEALGTARKPLVKFVPRFPDEGVAYAPSVLLIEDPHEWFGFVTGELVALVIVDLDVLELRFAEGGFRCAITPRADRPIVLTPMDPERAMAEASIGSHIFNRIFVELVSVEWFVSEALGRLTASEALKSIEAHPKRARNGASSSSSYEPSFVKSFDG